MTAVTDNPGKSRYELEEGDHIAFASYRREGATLVIPHVEAPPELRGSGAAGRLMQGVMEIARAENLRVVATCSYAAAWIKRHKEFQDVAE